MTTIESPPTEIKRPLMVSRSPSSSISITTSTIIPLSSNTNNDNWVNMDLDNYDKSSSSIIYNTSTELENLEKFNSSINSSLNSVDHGEENLRTVKLNSVKDVLSNLSNESGTIDDKLKNLKKLSTTVQEISQNVQYNNIINNDMRIKIWSEFLNLSNTTNASLETNSSITSSSSMKPKNPTDITPSSNSVLSTPTTLNNGRFSPQLFLENLNSIDLPPHKDEEQVKLDIQRSFTILSHIQQQTIPSSSSSSIHLINNSLNHNNNNNSQFGNVETMEKGSSFATIFSSSDIKNLKKILLNLIIKILRKYPNLGYYQGYHDIASIVLLICYNNNHNRQDSTNGKIESPSTSTSSSIEDNIDQELAFKILEKLTIYHLRDFMISDINLSVNHLRNIPTILELCDKQLFELVKQTSQSYHLIHGEKFYDYKFYQGLSSILTLYSHDITNLNHILTIWDFTLSYNSVLINSYIYASSLIIFKSKIWDFLQLDSEQLEFNDIDQDLVHTTLSPANLFDGLNDEEISQILQKTKELVEKYPIDNTSNWKKLFNSYNLHSVLNNTSNIKSDTITIETQYGKLLNSNNHELTDLIHLQDEEINKQTIEELQEQQQLIEEEEELHNLKRSSTNESEDLDEDLDEDSHLNSLSSSLTLNTSSSIHKLKSSKFFQKLFKSTSITSSDEDEDNDDKVISTNKASHNWSYSPYSIIQRLSSINKFYKFGIAIGIIGFILHLIINNKNFYQIYKENLSDFFTNFHFVEIGQNLISKSFKQSSSVFQIGSGSLRNSIFGFEI
ncbi:GYP8 [Candida jiufengensis]|uniref:GYP8 n=1 Tax=Candida jiufengensis TaxID=497108 RepID=UPI002224FE11|nr:GYP8 [Candida jiufengensis]KAI5956214.1 GYP8 [Candida jiufengensis]